MAKAKGSGDFTTLGYNAVALKGKTKTYGGKEYLELTGSLTLPDGTTAIVTVRKSPGKELIYIAKDQRSGAEIPQMWCQVTIGRKSGGGKKW